MQKSVKVIGIECSAMDCQTESCSFRLMMTRRYLTYCKYNAVGVACK